MYDVDIGKLNTPFISSLPIFPHASSPYRNAGIRQVSYSLSLTLTSSFPTWCFTPFSLISVLIASHFLFNSDDDDDDDDDDEMLLLYD